MQVAFHIGAHSTDNDQLIKGMLKNKKALTSVGVAVPGPSRYRTLIRETTQALHGAKPMIDTQNALMDEILEDEPADRLLLANEHFICVQQKVLEHGVLYAKTEEKISALTNLFHGHEVEFFLAIANPATFLPAIASRLKGKDFAKWYGMTDAAALKWSEMIQRIRNASPDAQITVWSNEDTPLIWAQVMREFAGVDHSEEMVGQFDILAQIMRKEGMKRFKEYIAANPPTNEVHLRRIIAAFLDKYALEDEVEVELDIPGWTEQYVDRLTDLYDEDCYEVARIPGVQFITP
ncbi:MAG: hypothetical protein ABJO67_20975 [Pseudoruegeria sp.]